MQQRPSSEVRGDRVLAAMPRHPHEEEARVLKEAEVKEFLLTLLGGRPPVGLPLPPGVERNHRVTLPGGRKPPVAECAAREAIGKAMMSVL